MLKKDFLLYLHADWKRAVEQCSAELAQAADANRLAKLERLRKADQWLTFYAAQLRKLYSIEA
jgi:hypothetical protein